MLGLGIHWPNWGMQHRNNAQQPIPASMPKTQQLACMSPANNLQPLSTAWRSPYIKKKEQHSAGVHVAGLTRCASTTFCNSGSNGQVQNQRTATLAKASLAHV
jgi:hypothetical protein